MKYFECTRCNEQFAHSGLGVIRCPECESVKVDEIPEVDSPLPDDENEEDFIDEAWWEEETLAETEEELDQEFDT